MALADIDSGLHALAGRSGLVDDLAKLAAQGLLYVAVAGFAVLWLRRDALRAGIAGVLGALLGLGLGAVVGALWDRPRPFAAGGYAPLVSHAADASFPSDHLIALGALSASAWLCWRRVGVAMAVIAVLLAVARAITGIHYLTDLAGGFAIGAVMTLVAWWALTPALPLLVAVDEWLTRLRLRPRAATASPGEAG